MGLITLLRHAPLALEYQKKYIGHSDIDIDNSLVNFSKLEKIQKKSYDLVFSSDLKRCTQTLDLLDLDYQTEKRIREVRFKKEFEGKSFSEIENHPTFDKKYLDSFERWHSFICDESLEVFEKRIKSFLDELPKDKNILLCTHAGTINKIYSILVEEKNLDIKYLETIFINIS